jgi:hypothetical protein
MQQTTNQKGEIMKRVRFLGVALATLALCFSSFAQTPAPASAYFAAPFAPYAEGMASSSPAGGVAGSVGIGIESETKHLYLDASGLFNTQQVSGGGYSGTITTQGYLKLGFLLLGGGADWTVNSNSASSYLTNCKSEGAKVCALAVKNSANPFVGGGFQIKRLRTILTYQIPVGANALPGEQQFNVSNEFAINKHIRLIAPVSFTTYFDGQGVAATHSATVASYGGGVKFVW